MQPHPLAKILLLKLIRFGQIWLDLGKTEAKFEQIWLDLGKIEAKLSQKYLDLGKNQNLASLKTSDLLVQCSHFYKFYLFER